MYLRASTLCCFHNISIPILSKCCVWCVRSETKVRKHVALHPQKRDGLLGTRKGVGRGGGRGRKSEWLVRSLPLGSRPKRPWTTARTTTVLRQWRPRHCVGACVLRSCCLNCCAEQSHKDSVRNTAVGEQLKLPFHFAVFLLLLFNAEFSCSRPSWI